jgi:hypothetical protein
VHGGNFPVHGPGVKQHGAILGMQMHRNRTRVQHSITGMLEAFPFRLNRNGGPIFIYEGKTSLHPSRNDSMLEERSFELLHKIGWRTRVHAIDLLMHGRQKENSMQSPRERMLV